MLKYKRIFLIVFAVLFLVVLFLIKNKTIFQNQETYQGANQENGLYSATIADLITKGNEDTDSDGIPNWEEGLYGTDPTKKETTPGISDSVAIEKLKAQENQSGTSLENNTGNQDTTNLTQTDKFAREFFTTVSTLNQNGTIDQSTADQLSSSLSNQVQNTPQRKIFSLIDLKITKDNSTQAVQKYNDTLNSIFPKTPVKYTVLDVLQKFVNGENDVDSTVLSEFDPIIQQTQSIVTGMVKMNVPQSLSTLHLNVINAIQGLVENVSDIKLYDTDVIVSLGGISKYDQNTTTLESAINALKNAISQKLNN